MRTIPKKINIIWWQGLPDNLPQKFRKNIESIVKHNPDYRIVFWDEDSIREFFKNNFPPQYLQKLDSFKILHQKIDFSRYAILHGGNGNDGGGISVDTDCFALRGFDQLTPYIDESSFIISENSASKFENLIAHGSTEHFNNATILVSPQHPILKGLIDHIMDLECDPDTKGTSGRYFCTQRVTGPESVTRYLMQYRENITVIPNTFVESCAGRDDFCEIPETAILDHQHEGSWIDDFNTTQKVYFRTKNVIKNTWWVFLIIIIGVVTLRKISLQK